MRYYGSCFLGGYFVGGLRFDQIGHKIVMGFLRKFLMPPQV